MCTRLLGQVSALKPNYNQRSQNALKTGSIHAGATPTKLLVYLGCNRLKTGFLSVFDCGCDGCRIDMAVFSLLYRFLSVTGMVKLWSDCQSNARKYQKIKKKPFSIFNLLKAFKAFRPSRSLM